MTNFLKSALSFNDFPNTNKELVFLGKSNVGKSSLINSLYGKKTAYVGKTPGKTKMLNFFDVDNKYTFVDAPGYGYAKRSEKEIIQFGEMMEDYFQKRKELKLAILIIDVRHKPSKDDIDMKNYLDEFNIPYIIVANKIDKLSNNELFKAKKVLIENLNIKEENIRYISALKKDNTNIIKEEIESILLK